MTRGEVDVLQLGYVTRESSSSEATSAQSSQKQTIREGQQEAREEMLSDIGFA
ncbi:hypothetical protein [Halobacterium hubeiense]|uniref:hypothetical protein n=1 Tax=Halobacterium hubeiense TaxID=1407499 RepID=UPI0015C64239|nr:hypothetical protein [Halobacterium hubeiense]